MRMAVNWRGELRLFGWKMKSSYGEKIRALKNESRTTSKIFIGHLKLSVFCFPNFNRKAKVNLFRSVKITSLMNWVCVWRGWVQHLLRACLILRNVQKLFCLSLIFHRLRNFPYNFPAALFFLLLPNNVLASFHPHLFLIKHNVIARHLSPTPHRSRSPWVDAMRKMMQRHTVRVKKTGWKITIKTIAVRIKPIFHATICYEFGKLPFQ